MTPSTASKKPASVTSSTAKHAKHATHALDLITKALDPCLIDVYPIDATKAAQKELQKARKGYKTTSPHHLDHAQDHIDKAISHLASYEAQDPIDKASQCDPIDASQQDPIDKAINHLIHAQAMLRGWLGLS